MKLLHIADLHLGKRVCEHPMLEDQRHILKEIADIARAERADALLIAGDVYDRPVPPQEAVTLLSDFLCEMSKEKVAVYLIAGNHDSAERLDFCAELLGANGVHIMGDCNGAAQTMILEKGEERVALHLLPHFRPVALRHFLGEEISSSDEAFRALIDRTDLTLAPTNILLAHAFVTGAATSESEQVVVGTVDAVPADVFARFDYVALGHLHRPQAIGTNVRYAGSPLAYSFSEVGEPKSVTVIETGKQLNVRTVALHPLHEMREIRGGMAELLALSYSDDYIRAVVTDEEVPPDARVTLQGNFPNLMRFAVENSRTAHEEEIAFGESVMLRDPLELFAEFYEQQNGTSPDEVRLALMKTLFEAQEGER